MMEYQVLTESDVEQFIELGYICLKEAYPRKTALEAQNFLWDRIIEKYPEYDLRKEEPETWKPLLEKDAEAGDVMPAHPFMFHAPSQNHSGKPRFMCNRAAPLTEPMNLNRADGNYSVLELSIRKAQAA